MRHGIATEPGSGNRQLQEKAVGIDPDGLFSWRIRLAEDDRSIDLRSRPDSTHHIESDSLQ
ncbi:hypothetical protein XI08_26000 [Bradyrhizobium sp. CCBAU 11361]|nr:hypothetical protein [Bradyrhizobium sp. CCBAU 11361]